MENKTEIFTITKTKQELQFDRQKLDSMNCHAWIWILFINSVPLCGIVIGVIFRKNCPMETNIPLWEIVNGFAMICFLLLIFVSKRTYINQTWKNSTVYLIDQLKILIIFFLFIWFICGNVGSMDFK